MLLKKETIFTIIGTSLTIATIVIGIIEYKGSQKYNIKMEFLRMDVQKQMEVYSNLCNSLGRLVAVTDNPRQYKDRYKEFISLYWGDVILVEDTTIENMMIRLRFDCDPADIVLSNQEEVTTLKFKIEDFADSCRVSIKRRRDDLAKRVAD